MANFNAAWVTRVIATPQQKSRPDQTHGRIRIFESLYVAPASGAPAVADKIIWGALPLGAVMRPHLARLDFNTGTATSTINLGDSCVAAKHMAATSIAATGSAVPSVAAFIKTCVADATISTFTLLNIKGMGALTVGDLVTGTGIPLGSTIASIDLGNRSAVFTNAALASATATNAAITVTSTGANYRASDNSATNDNGFVSTLDDATLISVVATAAVAVNQVIRLQMPYVMD